MARNLKPLAEILQGKEGRVSQVYVDTQLKLFTRGRHMREGETRTFDLTMVEEDERFEGHEVVHETWTRNPKVYRGKLLNVSRDKQGLYQVHFHRMVLTKRMSAERVSKAICRDLSNAKKVLCL